MKIKIVIDNDTLDQNLIPEAGFSAFIVEEDKNILFDTGRKGNVIGNAAHLGIDLTKLDYIVFSHGHHDHTNGLADLKQLYEDKGIDKESRPKVIAHPQAFYPRFDGERYIGTKLNKQEVEESFEVIYSIKPIKITKKLWWLGEIPRRNDFESKKPVGKMHKNGQIDDDYILDDTAMVFQSKSGLVIISGCSHCGIGNILEQAINVTGEEKINIVLGGLHLKHESSEYIQKTIDELKKYNINKLHACHCTGDKAKEMLKDNLPQENIGCSFEAEYD